MEKNGCNLWPKSRLFVIVLGCILGVVLLRSDFSPSLFSSPWRVEAIG